MQNQAMKRRTSVEVKGRTTAMVLRAAVREACMSGVLATGLLVGPLVHGADLQPASTTAVASDPIAFDIPAQSLETALLRFSEQARMQVVVANGVASGAMSPQVKGEFSAAEALRLLLEQTELTYEVTGARTIAIRMAAQGEAFENISHSDTEPESYSIRMAQAQIDRDQPQSAREQELTAASQKRTASIEEVLVTGSHIRGSQNLSSPIIELDRADIDASDYATTQELIRSLPQNLGNVSELTQGGVNGGAGQALTFEGAGINLRGMGSDSTLVLLDGRRLAAAGNGSFVDISLIPLSAVERVEVLTDGASAIYGSDAVGGVVNFRLRKDFDGAETRVRYGTVTQGSHDHVQAGQMFGHTWSSGQALLSYEYFGQSRLAGSDRSFFQPVEFMQDIELVPEQKRHGALAVLSQRLSERLELSSQLSFGDRESSSAYAQGEPYNYFYDATGQQLGASVGISVDFANRWQARMMGLWDRNQSELATYFASTRELAQLLPTEGNVWSVDLAADGPLLEVGGGSVRFAVGGQFRKEKFEDLSDSNPANIDRNVSALYAELVMPWIGSGNRRRAQLTVNW